MFAPWSAVAGGAGTTEPIASLVVHTDAVIQTRDATNGRVFVFQSLLLLLKQWQIDPINNNISIPIC